MYQAIHRNYQIRRIGSPAMAKAYRNGELKTIRTPSMDLWVNALQFGQVKLDQVLTLHHSLEFEWQWPVAEAEFGRCDGICDSWHRYKLWFFEFTDTADKLRPIRVLLVSDAPSIGRGSCMEWLDQPQNIDQLLAIQSFFCDNHPRNQRKGKALAPR